MTDGETPCSQLVAKEEGEPSFVKDVFNYYKTNSVPYGVENSEDFVERAKFYKIENDVLYFDSNLRVPIRVSEKDVLLGTQNKIDFASWYESLGRAYYWPNFDVDVGNAFPSGESSSWGSSLWSSVTVMRLVLTESEVIYLMRDDRSGFIYGDVSLRDEVSSLAEFVFGAFCRYGFMRGKISLIGFIEPWLHRFKVEMASLFRQVSEMKNRRDFYSRIYSSITNEEDSHLIEGFKKSINADPFTWKRGLQGMILTRNLESGSFYAFYSLKRSFNSVIQNKSSQDNFLPKKKIKTSESKVNLQQKDVISDGSEIKESVVSAVKSLLSVTKLERSRRGKYFKYDPEIRDAIAEFALKNGIAEASKHFTEKLNLKISPSTIRNFIRSYKIYTPEMKDEIGKYASIHGAEKCYQNYKSKYEIEGEDSFTLALVYRFKKYYENKTTASINDDGSTRIFVVDIPSAEDQDHCITKNFFNSELKNDIGRYAYHCGNKKTVEHFSNRLQIPMKESTVRKFKKKWMESNNIKNDSQTTSKVQKDPKLATPCIKESSTMDHQQLVQDEFPLTKSTYEYANSDKEAFINEDNSKRGQYILYTPEMRATIAKYAIAHGNRETIDYFRNNFDLSLPESTIRTIKDKYLSSKTSDQDIDKLDYGPRGRPMRLGSYDALVQNCISDLKASGEKLTSFMVIATAKQVLLKHNPSLLKENGGHISLDPSWAKSFLRRLRKSSDVKKRTTESVTLGALYN